LSGGGGILCQRCWDCLGTGFTVSDINCHRCGGLKASSLPVCPHCGARQNDGALTESVSYRDTLLALAPPILGTVGGWLLVGSEWGIVTGLLIGLFVGVGLVAERHLRQTRQ
jgi:hypothetical protein